MKQIMQSKDVVEVVEPLLSHTGQEELWMLSLDNQNNVRHTHLVGLGSDGNVIICGKAIARHAVLDMAAKVVIAHNHPSGNPIPSRADIEETGKLRGGLALLDIGLTDHVILGEGRWYSFVDEKVTERKESKRIAV